MIHDRGAKQRTVFESDEPVTGIEFREGSTTVLYIATTGRILTLVISGRGQGQSARPLDETGCGVGCMTVDKKTQDVVVARDDGVYYYGLHGRGPYYAYEGPKKMISTYKDYVALVSTPQTDTLTKSSSLRAFGSGQADDLFSTSSFILLNTDLKFVAHREALSSQIKATFVEWGDFFVLTLDGKVRHSYPAKCSLTFTVVPIPREALPTKARHLVPARSLRPCHQPCPEIRRRRCPTERDIPQVW